MVILGSAATLQFQHNLKVLRKKGFSLHGESCYWRHRNGLCAYIKNRFATKNGHLDVKAIFTANIITNFCFESNIHVVEKIIWFLTFLNKCFWHTCTITMVTTTTEEVSESIFYQLLNSLRLQTTISVVGKLGKWRENSCGIYTTEIQLD